MREAQFKGICQCISRSGLFSMLRVEALSLVSRQEQPHDAKYQNPCETVVSAQAHKVALRALLQAVVLINIGKLVEYVYTRESLC